MGKKRSIKFQVIAFFKKLGLAIKCKCRLKHLKYIGYTDCSWKKKGAKLFQFNITKPNHSRYQSTVGFKYGY